MIFSPRQTADRLDTFAFHILYLMDGQLDLKVLWDGHLAHPSWAGKMPTPQFIKGFNDKVAHRVI